MLVGHLRRLCALFVASVLFTVAAPPEPNKDLVESFGWNKIDLREYPPKVDMGSYLYVKGSHDAPKTLSIDFAEPNTVDWKNLESIEINFQYWGIGGSSVNDNKTRVKGTTLFRIAVVTCDQDKPDTKWASFEPETYDPLKWNLLKFGSPEFNLTCYQRISIMVLSSSTWIKGKGTYLAAIRNVEIACTFRDFSSKDKRSVQLFGCYSPLDCKHFRIYPENPWSNSGFPARSKEFFLVCTPDEQPEEAFRMTIRRPPKMDSCLRFAYWATDGTLLYLHVSMKIRFELGPTYQSQDSAIIYRWYHVKFCLSHFLTNRSSTNIVALLISKKKFSNLSSEMVAISEILSDHVTTSSNLSDIFSNILSHWSKRKAIHEWHCIPEELWEWKYDVQSTLILRISTPGTGSAYFYSRWIQHHKNQKLRFKVSWTNLSTAAYSITAKIYDENFVEVNEEELFLQETSSSISSVLVIPNMAAPEALYKVQFRINWIHKSPISGAIVFSDVDIGDACRNGSRACGYHGRCVVLGPEDFACDCNPGYYGPFCEYLDLGPQPTTENSSKIIDICQDFNCLNGICIKSNDSFAFCNCHQGFHGIRCEFKNETQTRKLAVIFLVLLAILLIALIGYCLFLLLRQHSSSTWMLGKRNRSSPRSDIQLSQVKRRSKGE